MSAHLQIETLFGAPVARVRPLQGGDLSEVFRVDLKDGRRIAVKRGPLVAVEARMLTAMAQIGAPVPEVLHQADSLLCLQWLKETAPTAGNWAALGQALARLHRVAGQSYGWPEDYAFGKVQIRNTARENWVTFWAENRLLPFLPDLPADLATRVEALARDLSSHLPDAPRPALLHGDIWSGNALFTGDKTYLIDPACYYGDAEVDLAMMALFGAPPSDFTSAYGALADGAAFRRPIYQLWPALVHLRLFGDGYRRLVERLLATSGH